MGRRLKGVLAAGVICAGLAGCTSQGPEATPQITTPKVSPSETLATADLPVTTQQTSPSQNVATPAVSLLQSSATATASLGNVTDVQVNPRSFCNTLELLFGEVPNAYLRDLPIWGAVYLPGCLVSQIPPLHSTTGSVSVVVGGIVPPTTNTTIHHSVAIRICGGLYDSALHRMTTTNCQAGS